MLAVVKTEDFSADVRQQIRWYLYEAGLDDVLAAELVARFASAIEDMLDFLEPFGRFRIYYRVLGEEFHAERLLEGHRLAASDDR